ncbi:MAG: hypothetical protein DI585_05685, partial [Pseudomonas fluorescens]
MIISPALTQYHLTRTLQSPATGVFLVCGWVAAILLAFTVGRFFPNNRADLSSLMAYLPWVMAVLVSTLAMPVATEGQRGITERLATLPHTALQRLLSRFLVSW